MEIASEFRYRNRVLNGRTLCVFVSQSGETADTLAASRYAKSSGHANIGILNSHDSSMARECDHFLPINAGNETSVASTKALTCQLVTLFSLAVLAGRQRKCLSRTEEMEVVRKLRAIPGLVNLALAADEAIRSIATDITDANSVLFLGRGTMYPLALEGALKPEGDQLYSCRRTA